MKPQTKKIVAREEKMNKQSRFKYIFFIFIVGVVFTAGLYYQHMAGNLQLVGLGFVAIIWTLLAALWDLLIKFWWLMLIIWVVVHYLFKISDIKDEIDCLEGHLKAIDMQLDFLEEHMNRLEEKIHELRISQIKDK